MKLAAAARHLNLAVSTIGLMAKRGELHVDPETDSSDARFVTRASVEKYRSTRIDVQRKTKLAGATVSLADLV